MSPDRTNGNPCGEAGPKPPRQLRPEDAYSASSSSSRAVRARAAGEGCRGRIICISSIAAYTGGSAGGALAYGAAKAGVLGLVRALARELAPTGIAANAIAPGLVAGTDFFGPGDHTERVERTVAQIPAGRPGAPDDVAAAAAFLASPGADYINGQVLHVNGGWYLGG